MVDEDGFRLNVGIILANVEQKLFWGRRIGKKDAWQFPQGGIQPDETLEEAMYRELYEEIGLQKDQVDLLKVTENWSYYHLPMHLRRIHQKPLCIGQKQKWFLLRLRVPDHFICFNRTSMPEFSAWRWVSYWYPLVQVISFKRTIYKNILTEFKHVFE